MNDVNDLRQLQARIRTLLADALQSATDLDEMTRMRDAIEVKDADRRDVLHAEEQAHIAMALDHRDVVGQAKGIIMSSLGCSADTAFGLLVHQSQRENRKVYEVAVEIIAHTQRPRSTESPT